MTPVEAMELVDAKARRVMTTVGKHPPVVLVFGLTGEYDVVTVAPPMRDRADRRVLRALLEQAAQNGATMVAMVMEAWSANESPELEAWRDAHDGWINEYPGRSEVLMVELRSRDGEAMHRSYDILRNGERVALSPRGLSISKNYFLDDLPWRSDS